MELPAFCRGCSEPRPPLREPVPRLQSAPRPGPSFLIRDILADCRPLCDPVPVLCDPVPVLCDPVPVLCDPVPVLPDPVPVLPDPVPVLCDPVPVLCDPGGFRDRSHGSSSPDSEFRESGEQRLKKGRKARTAFSEQQLLRLERSFQSQRYLSVQDRMRLAAELQLRDMQVKTWYQNRRTKWKRQSVGMELMFLPPHFLFPPAPPTLDMYLYRGHAPLYHQAPPLMN
ncbi:hypothetical protein OYC64_003176 [Pagothenia borchgrevinki]|uniref:Homeobox domain-containing protein n=1 Tax=Pagothenia borchgrevinki TaxID=8213 RepID=A0ABD2HBY0_PAGBO